MNPNVNVAMCQIEVESLNREKNLKTIEAAFHDACQGNRPDLVIFPELSNLGYVFQRDRDFGSKYLKAAEPVPDGPTSELLGKLCRQYGTYAICGICEADATIPGLVYNTATLFDRDGGLVGRQRKIHIPGEEKHYFTQSNEINVFKTDFANLAMQICYDLQFPEVSRLQTYMGAEIIVSCWNAPSYVTPPNVLYALIACRAIENHLYSIGCNRCGLHGQALFEGNSLAVDPAGKSLNELSAEPSVVRVTLTELPMLEERAFQPTLRDARYDVIKENFRHAQSLYKLTTNDCCCCGD